MRDATVVRVEIGSADEWADTLARVYDVPLALQGVNRNFAAVITHLPLSDRVGITEITSNGCRLERTQRLVRIAPSDDLFLNVKLDDGGTISQDGRQVQALKGVGVFHDASRPYQLDYEVGGSGLVFQLSRRELLGSPNEQLPAGFWMAPDIATLRVLRAVAAEALHAGEELRTHEAESLSVVVTDLIRASIRSVHDGRPSVPVERAAMLQLIRRTIADELADPALTPNQLARRFNVSLRSLQAMFADVGESPAAYIREQRLMATYHRLGAARYQHLSITDIAIASGFTDPSTFSRAFRHRFGMSPRDCRAGAPVSAGSPGVPDVTLAPAAAD